jgi:hypothetical protein
MDEHLLSSPTGAHSENATDVAIDPIVHLTCPHTPKGPVYALAAPLQRESCRAIKAMPREPYHFVVFYPTRVEAARWEIEENIAHGDEDWVREENM